MFGDDRKMEYKVSEELDLLEIMIYEWAKDYIVNTNQLRTQYKQYEGKVNFEKIYREIVRYRIEKYGTSSIVPYRKKSREQCYYEAEKVRKKMYRKVGAKFRQWKEC